MSSRPNGFLGRPLVLFRVRGIDIALHPTWLITVGVLSVVFGRVFVPTRFSGIAGAALSVGLALLFYVFVLLHEFAHTMVALRYDLNPRSIILFALGGVSQIDKEATEPRQEYYVALAGPLASLLIAGGLSLTSHALHPGHRDLVGTGLWGSLAWLNLTLAGFNLVPGFPLDGGRVFRSAVWAFSGNRLKATRWAATGGRLVGGGMVAGGIAFLIFGPNDNGNRYMGVWFAALGLFLYQMATTANRAELEREIVRASSQPLFEAPPLPSGPDIVPVERPRRRPAVKRVTPRTPEARLKPRVQKRKPDEGNASKSDPRGRRRRSPQRPGASSPSAAQPRDGARDSRARPSDARGRTRRER